MRDRSERIFCLALLAIALIKFWPAFPNNQTIAWPGDAWGTIGFIFDHYDQVLKHGFGSMFKGIYFSDGIGAGVNWRGGFCNWVYQVTYFLLMGVSGSPDNVYDFTCMVFFFLTGFCAWRMARSVGLNETFSALFALLMTFNANFTGRLAAHIGLASVFAPILAIHVLIKTVRTPELKKFILLALVVLGNFLFNEYYGYFITITVALTLLIWLPIRIWRYDDTDDDSAISPKRVGLNVAVATLIFGAGMYASYQPLIEQKFFRSHKPGPDAAQILVKGHDPIQFEIYSLAHPLQFFHSHTHFLRPLVPKFVRRANPDMEFNYYVGYLTLLLIPFAIFAMYRYRSQSDDHADDGDDEVTVAVLCTVFLIALSLASTPQRWYALSPIAQHFAPMFRVSARAQLLAQIALFPLLFLAAQRWLNHLSQAGKNPNLKRIAIVLTTLAAGVQFFELTYKTKPFSALPTTQLPRSELYVALAQLPRGTALELPFHYPPKDPPESVYNYVLGRIIHKKPIVNGIDFAMFGKDLENAGVRLKINESAAVQIPNFERCGIRYLVVHFGSAYDFSPLHSRADISRVFANSEGEIYTLGQPGIAFSPECFRASYFLN